jgi:hypothetical protein
MSILRTLGGVSTQLNDTNEPHFNTKKYTPVWGQRAQLREEAWKTNVHVLAI